MRSPRIEDSDGAHCRWPSGRDVRCRRIRNCRGSLRRPCSWQKQNLGRSELSAVINRRNRPGSTKAVVLVPCPHTVFPLRSLKSKSIRRPASSKSNRVWIAHDIGRAINPLLVIGQVEGSVYMGLGEALMEEHGVSRYRVYTSHRACSITRVRRRWTCVHSKTLLVEEPDPIGPFGAKEVGQGPLLPMPPAVCNAVYDAVGVRHRRNSGHAGKNLEGAPKAKRKAKTAGTGRSRFRRSSIAIRLFILPPWEGGDGRARISPSTRERDCSRAETSRFYFPQPERCSRGRDHPGREGPRAMVVAGGTDLWPKMKRRQMEPRVVIGLRHLSELQA